MISRLEFKGLPLETGRRKDVVWTGKREGYALGSRGRDSARIVLLPQEVAGIPAVHTSHKRLVQNVSVSNQTMKG